MQLLHSSCALIVVASICSFGQEPPAAEALAQKQKPKTNLEQFQAKTGSVIVMGYSSIGTVKGEFGSYVEIETREFTDVSSNAKQFGVYIKVKEAGRLERESASYIDLDEIDSLVKGIDYISRLTPDVSKLGSFQAEYRTRGDLAVTTFGTAKGKVQAAVKSGTFGAVSAFISLDDLKQVKQFLLKAAATLESLKAG